ncbi:glycoside hydrolase family 26 protein [Streptomyces sp. NPDC054784]
MPYRPWAVTGACLGAVTAGLLVTTALPVPEHGRTDGKGTGRDSASLSADTGEFPAGERPRPAGGAPGAPAGGPADGSAGRAASDVPFGAFLGSGPEGVRRMAGLKRWLDGREPRVGHTYLPGDLWSNIEGEPDFLRPWAKWRQARADRLFVLNVPLLERNEEGVPDAEVARLLRAGADGRFDRHFRTLAERLVALGLADTVLVPGWEMNGVTYTHRCAPDPRAWKAYWRRVVTAMRAVPGQRFRFDFAPSRGEDAIGWTKCYPGDRWVDIVGMDSYDQPPGGRFAEHVRQPYGLQHQVDFAARHGKPVSYPEWGLFRGGDNPAYVRGMLGWMRKHRPVYHTITDYCPHGVWRCGRNPDSTEVFRALMSAPEPRPTPKPTPTPTPTPTPSTPEARPSGSPEWKPEHPSGREFCLNLGEWVEKLLGGGRFCFRHGG